MSDDGGSEVSLDYYEWSHSLDWYRIRWRIQEGPIWENIHVLDDPCDPNSPQKPFQDENGNLHEVASRPLSDTEDLTTLIVHFNWLDDYDAYERLSRLKFTLPEGQECFTIGDYVLRVHPWLVERRAQVLEELLAVQEYFGPEGEPLHESWPADVEIWMQTSYAQFHGVQLLNSGVDDINLSWAVAATEAQDKRYEQKRERRERARIPPGQEEPKASLAFHRLRWELREGGSIRECVRVIKSVLELGSEEQEPFQAESGEFHEIADLPATVIPTSRLVLYFPKLEGTGFSSRWSNDDGSYDMTPRPDNIESEWSPELTLVAGEGRDFISIKDYVFGAFDWILSLKSRVMEATHRWYPSDNPEEVWLDPTEVYAVSFYSTKEHGGMYDQWRIVTWSAQEMQGIDPSANSPFPTLQVTL